MTPLSPADRSRARALALGVSLALGWVLWLAWVHRGHFVDDAFIGFRYGANLLAGWGLVFNAGEAVEGVTNVGWVLLVAGLGWLGPLPVVAKGVGLVFLVAAVGLVAWGYRRLAAEASEMEVGLLPVLVVAQPETVYFSLAGMETGLAALLLVGMLWCFLGGRGRPVLAAVLGGALFTVRPETVVLFPGFVLLALALGRPGRVSSPGADGTAEAAALRGASSRGRFVLALALFGALVLAVTAARFGYYGEPLPNTFLAKGPGGPGEVLGRVWETLLGRNPNAPAPFGGLLLPVAGGYGAWWLWRRRAVPALLLAAAAGTGLFFAAYARPDWTGMGRYLAPYAPLAAVLLVRGLFAGLARLPRLGSRTARGVAVLVVLSLAGFGFWRTHEHLGAEALGEYPGFVLASETLVPAARWIDRELPADATIAARRIGALGYHGRRAVFDYAFGLTDPRVARLAASRGEGFENPADEDLAGIWRSAAPGCLLEDDDRVARLRPHPARPGELEVHGLRYQVVRSFGLGKGRTRWLLACRPGVAGGGRLTARR
jgi:arabinofuranosyltransferase